MHIIMATAWKQQDATGMKSGYCEKAGPSLNVPRRHVVRRTNFGGDRPTAHFKDTTVYRLEQLHSLRKLTVDNFWSDDMLFRSDVGRHADLSHLTVSFFNISVPLRTCRASSIVSLCGS